MFVFNLLNQTASFQSWLPLESCFRSLQLIRALACLSGINHDSCCTAGWRLPSLRWSGSISSLLTPTALQRYSTGRGAKPSLTGQTVTLPYSIHAGRVGGQREGAEEGSRGRGPRSGLRKGGPTEWAEGGGQGRGPKGEAKGGNTDRSVGCRSIEVIIQTLSFSLTLNIDRTRMAWALALTFDLWPMTWLVSICIAHCPLLH